MRLMVTFLLIIIVSLINFACNGETDDSSAVEIGGDNALDDDAGDDDVSDDDALDDDTAFIMDCIVNRETCNREIP